MAKACQVKSGPKKGKLKKGWRYGKNGSCVKAKSSRKSAGSKRRKGGCKYGYLKNPTKTRKCKKRPGGRRRR